MVCLLDQYIITKTKTKIKIINHRQSNRHISRTSSGCGCLVLFRSLFFNGFSQCLTSPISMSLFYSFQPLQDSELASAVFAFCLQRRWRASNIWVQVESLNPSLPCFKVNIDRFPHPHPQKLSSKWMVMKKWNFHFRLVNLILHLVDPPGACMRWECRHCPLL
jgi:hypothetical protein